MIRTDYPIARVWGIPIKVHLSLLFLLPLLACGYAPLLDSTGVAGAGWWWGLLLAVSIFLCVTLHELGHALAALRLGLKVREILLLPIGGATQLADVPRRPRQEVILALAGPAVSLGLALGFLLGARFAFQQAPALRSLWTVLGFLVDINLFLALFNLLPALPMDGGRVMRALLTPRLGRLRATRWAVYSGKTVAVLIGILVGLAALAAGNHWATSVMGNVWWIVIAIFLFTAADLEFQMAKIEERLRQAEAKRRAAAAAATGDMVIVSPSPYSKDTAPIQVEPVREYRKRGGRSWVG